MSRTMATKQAGAAVEKQVVQLGNLRNAGTRAPEFREWRQATLTLIERIWPDQATRAQRFRRIPFSVAAATAEDRVQREAFERGCAEARRLLQLWHSEIEMHGIRQEPEAPALSEAVRVALDELNPPVITPSPAKAVAKPRRRREKLSEMLGFTDTASLEAPAAAAAGDTLADSIDKALEVAMHDSLAAHAAQDSAAGVASPVPVPVPVPAPELVRKPKPMVSYVARAFIAMADDLEELGIPPAHRDRVRLALLDLAHHLDAGSVTWHLMRDAVTLVMHYPALGRQAVPLLLPYLEAAA